MQMRCLGEEKREEKRKTPFAIQIRRRRRRVLVGVEKGRRKRRTEEGEEEGGKEEEAETETLYFQFTFIGHLVSFTPIDANLCKFMQ